MARVAKRTGKVCLDTDIVIDYLRKTKETENLINKLFSRFSDTTITIITVYELLIGVEYSDGRGRNDVEEIINIITILPFDVKASREAAKITAELKKSGQQIGIADELIAAICKTHNTCLLTKNVSHFQRIRNLKVIGLNEI
jgi:predicted nucleic acid-binding protein